LVPWKGFCGRAVHVESVQEEAVHRALNTFCTPRYGKVNINKKPEVLVLKFKYVCYIGLGKVSTEQNKSNLEKCQRNKTNLK
jgi:hypothetical protein